MTKQNGVWVFVQQDNGRVVEVSVELLCKARELADRVNAELVGVLIGCDVKAQAASLIPYGADEILCVEDERLEHYASVPYAKIMTALIERHRPQIVLYGATSTGRDLAPRIASKLRVGLTADCTDLRIGDYASRDTSYDNILYQIRPAFGGNVIATIVSAGFLPQMATVREGVMRLREPDPAFEGVVVSVTAELEAADFSAELLEHTQLERSVNLKRARVIVAGGVGMGSREQFGLIEQLAQALGGEVGASRAAVDAGFVSKEHQVGQTGTTVRPGLYIACGISGSVQHQAGMHDASRILAVNTDPDAPIFRIAHYGIVGDVKEVIPRLISAYQACSAATERA